MVIIAGAGITGLAAAYELARRGVEFVLLEAGGRAGGLVHTEHIGGFTIDGGADSLLVQKPAAIQLCEDLGLAPRLMPTRLPRTAYVLRDGRLHALPSPSVLGIPTSLGALAGYSLLGWGDRLRLAAEPLMPRRRFEDESVASFFRRRFGPATVGLIAEPLLGGIHAGDIEQLSMPSIFPRLTEAEQTSGGVIRALARAPRPSAGAGGGLFRALRGGMSELVAAIIATLPAGALRTGAAVTALQRRGAGWSVHTDVEAFDAPSVILALPARTAAVLLRPVDDDAASACATVPYVSTASVALAWKREHIAHPLAGSGFVVARQHNSARITACTWVSSKWEDRAPAGHVLLRAFAGGAHDPGAVDATDDQLIDAAVRDLTPVLGIAAPPLLTRVFRWRDAGAQHVVGHRARMTALAARLGEHPGLFVAGSGFESIGIPDCIANGRRAGAAAADYVRMES